MIAEARRLRMVRQSQIVVVVVAAVAAECRILLVVPDRHSEVP